MKARQVLIAAAVMVVVLTGCRREGQDVTGSYGSGVLAGSVILNGIEGSPEGVEVSVRDTGMAMTLGADGKFAFSGVPEIAILDFRRGDGINASLTVHGSNKGGVTVELGQSGAARKTTGRGNSGKDKRELEGVIRSVSADELVLFTSHQEEVTIALTDETIIRKGNETLTAADLAAEMRVHVRARKVTDEYTALLVIVQDDSDDDDGEDDEKPELKDYEGTIVSASDAELVVFTSKKEEVTFTLSSETVIRKGNTTVAPSDLKPGQRVHVKALVEGDSATAVQVVLQNTKEKSEVTVSGTVVSVAGSNIVVATKAGEMTVQTDAATRIRKQGKTIAISAIAAGDSLSAKGSKVSENTILATEVEVRGKSGHP